MRKRANEPARKRLSEAWPELADVPYKGLSVYGIVREAAEEALDAAGEEDSEEFKRIQSYGRGFFSGYEILSLDFGIAPKSQRAALRAILNALMIGMSLGDPKRRDKIVLESMRMQAAKMRAVKKAKSAPQKQKTLAAVRAAMQATTRPPTRGEGYAKRILPKVREQLGRDISPSSIRDYVRVILEETPGKPGKP
jgi:hypothetical protein